MQKYPDIHCHSRTALEKVTVQSYLSYLWKYFVNEIIIKDKGIKSEIGEKHRQGRNHAEPGRDQEEGEPPLVRVDPCADVPFLVTITVETEQLGKDESPNGEKDQENESTQGALASIAHD